MVIQSSLISLIRWGKCLSIRCVIIIHSIRTVSVSSFEMTGNFILNSYSFALPFVFSSLMWNQGVKTFQFQYISLPYLFLVHFNVIESIHFKRYMKIQISQFRRNHLIVDFSKCCENIVISSYFYFIIKNQMKDLFVNQISVTNSRFAH